MVKTHGYDINHVEYRSSVPDSVYNFFSCLEGMKIKLWEQDNVTIGNAFHDLSKNDFGKETDKRDFKVGDYVEFRLKSDTGETDLIFIYKIVKQYKCKNEVYLYYVNFLKLW